MRILDYAANLEHVGDIVEQSLARLTLKKIKATAVRSGGYE